MAAIHHLWSLVRLLRVAANRKIGASDFNKPDTDIRFVTKTATSYSSETTKQQLLRPFDVNYHMQSRYDRAHVSVPFWASGRRSCGTT